MTTFESRPPGMPPMQPMQPMPVRPAKQRNVVGIIALVCAIVGFVFSCIPGAVIVGWVLLPIAFILGIVGVCLPSKTKGTSVSAIIVSIVGTVVAVAVFFAFVANAFDKAFTEEFGSGNVEVQSQENGLVRSVSGSEEGEGSGDIGTRENPATIGSVLSSEDWDVVVNEFRPYADSEVAEANMFNEPAAEGLHYAVVNVTATYKGEGSDMVDMIQVAFVAEDGNVYNSFDARAVSPEPMLTGEVYTGGSITGNQVLLLPESPGLLRLGLGVFGDEVFVAVQ